ncbi:MAG: prolipoprotein diacylglyceryl transferase [Oscillospiraceae bacterium]|jgi:phosphatidylglycerol:prolipoprotein diacylglycerol transferase|nr:prolipoprotein diacylglyceryl transferase [Oscillospiraceae bacterium]
MKVQFPGIGLEMTVNDVAFSIGSFEVAWYGLIIMTGFFLAVLYALYNLKRFDIKIDPFIDVIILGLILAVVGARTYYVVFRLDMYDSFAEVINIRSGGLAIYGGVIGAVIAALVGAKWKKISLASMLDVAAIGFLLGQGLGRWGNFTNQEAFGSYTDLPWGMLSPNTLSVVPEGPVHPCFYYESIWCLVGFVGLHFVSRYFYKFRGQLGLMYLLWYGLGRAWIEELRTDSLWLVEDVIKVSWLLAMVSIVVVPIFLYLGFKGILFDRVSSDLKTVKLRDWKLALANGANASQVEGVADTAEGSDSTDSADTADTDDSTDSTEASSDGKSEE